MNDGYKTWGVLKNVLCNRGFGINVKNCLHEEVILPTALYRREAWGMRRAEKRKANILERKCLRSLVGVTQMDRVRNKEVLRRAIIDRKLASRVDETAMRRFGHI